MSGKEVKEMIIENGLRLWEVAEALGMHDSNFSRKLRKTLTDEEVSKIKSVIDTLTKEKGECK